MSVKNLNELLLTVQKPGRYVGGEWNAVRKEWTADKVKVCLAFPDVYEVGMSYLGTKILYGILNGRDDCLCERVFSPWADFEAVLRTNAIPLYSLESRRPLKEFDIIGVSIAYELAYTNVLNLLDLGGIPVRSSERGDGDPLIIAGGPSCFNPEPVAEFIDAFVIGDGEEAVGEIVEAYKAARGKEHPHHSLRSGAGQAGARQKLLRELAKIPGVYVPSLYKVDYNDDGTIKSFAETQEGVPPVIKKRFVKDLDKAFYPTKQIVPNIGIVHDRIAIEIMRGCKHACRFCQATTTYRPCRERSKDEIVRLARESYAETGYDEVSLLSLSSVDHSRLREIIEALNTVFAGKAVSVSVPSLRIEDALKDLPVLIAKVKKSGLTFAPEAGSEKMRKVLRKDITIDRLFDAATESFRSGWKRVKLYFMIGLPGESDEDVSGIVDLIYKISDLRKASGGRAAEVVASVNAFIPKPHTPFQWDAMDQVDALERKRELLRRSIRGKHIQLDVHPFRMGLLEAAMSRGDRRLGGVIAEAWKNGARFDGWQDCFRFDVWTAAFHACGLDPVHYACRKRGAEELLPWDHIDVGAGKTALLKEASLACRAPSI